MACFKITGAEDISSVLVGLYHRKDIVLTDKEKRAIDNALCIVEQARVLANCSDIMEKDMGEFCVEGEEQ